MMKNKVKLRLDWETLRKMYVLAYKDGEGVQDFVEEQFAEFIDMKYKSRNRGGKGSYTPLGRSLI